MTFQPKLVACKEWLAGRCTAKCAHGTIHPEDDMVNCAIFGRKCSATCIMVTTADQVLMALARAIAQRNLDDVDMKYDNPFNAVVTLLDRVPADPGPTEFEPVEPDEVVNLLPSPPLSREAAKAIARDIVQELREDKPAAVPVPAGGDATVFIPGEARF